MSERSEFGSNKMKQLMHDYIIFNVPVSLCVSWSTTATTTATTFTKSNRESNYLNINFIFETFTVHSTKSLN